MSGINNVESKKIRKELIVLVEQEKEISRKKEECLEVLQREHQHSTLIAYYHKNGEISTFCVFCGICETIPYSSPKDWRKMKKIFWVSQREFWKRKSNLFKRLGIFETLE